MRWSRGLTGCAVVFACAVSACERPQETTTREVRAATATFLDALKYGDAQALVDAHIEGSPRSQWCTSESFRAVLESVRARKPSAQECTQVRRAMRAGEEVTDEERLMLQTVRFICEEPNGRCHDYARRVFTSQLEDAPLWRARPTSYTIREVTLRGDGRAAVYVDLASAAPDAPRHITLHLQHTPLGWRVSDDLAQL